MFPGPSSHLGRETYLGQAAVGPAHSPIPARGPGLTFLLQLSLLGREGILPRRKFLVVGVLHRENVPPQSPSCYSRCRFLLISFLSMHQDSKGSEVWAGQRQGLQMLAWDASTTLQGLGGGHLSTSNGCFLPRHSLLWSSGLCCFGIMSRSCVGIGKSI